MLGQVYIYMGTDRWCLVRCTFTWEQTGGAWLGVQLHGNRQVVLGQVYSYMGTDRWCLVRLHGKGQVLETDMVLNGGHSSGWSFIRGCSALCLFQNLFLLFEIIWDGSEVAGFLWKKGSACINFLVVM